MYIPRMVPSNHDQCVLKDDQHAHFHILDKMTNVHILLQNNAHCKKDFTILIF